MQLKCDGLKEIRIDFTHMTTVAVETKNKDKDFEIAIISFPYPNLI
jgi:hypothetical protein